MRITDNMIECWNRDGASIEDRLRAALFKIERMHAERLKLDQRIHNQRRSCRITWEIVEMRRKWLGSDVARRSYVRLLKRHQKLLADRNKTAGDA